jgi:hypothetical protein
LRTRYGLGAAVAVALLFAPGPWMADACAGTLAQLQAQAATSKLRAAMQQRMQQHVDLCVGVARSANCRVAFESALRQTTQPSTTRGRLYESVVMNRAAPPAGEIAEFQHQITLRFNEDPEWKRRAKILARDGLPFVRMPQGANHELLVGVTPHGQLGVSLRDTTGE